jgi:hypothetical protein
MVVCPETAIAGLIDIPLACLGGYKIIKWVFRVFQEVFSGEIPVQNALQHPLLIKLTYFSGLHQYNFGCENGSRYRLFGEDAQSALKKCMSAGIGNLAREAGPRGQRNERSR